MFSQKKWRVSVPEGLTFSKSFFIISTILQNNKKRVPKEREKKKRKEKKRNSALVEIGTKRVRAAFGFVQMKLAQKEREHFRQARTITVEKGARIFLRGERNRKGNSMNRGTSIRGWLNSSGSIDQPASLPLCFAPIKSVTLFAGPSGGLAFAS